MGRTDTTWPQAS